MTRLLAVAAVLVVLGLAACAEPADSTAEPGTAGAPTARAATAAPTDSPTETPEATGEAIAPTETEEAAMPTEATSTGDANADVEQVRAVQGDDGTWTFHVTVAHPDTGWEDYADGWDVLTPDGTVLKADPDSPFTRLLTHPHETEQPFTRSQSGIAIPDGVTQVTVRAHDLVDGWGGHEVVVDLTADSGERFEVERGS